MTHESPQYLIVDGSGEVLEPARLPFDAICLGRGLFETVLVVSGKPVFPDRHEARLAASCQQLAVAGAREVAGIMAAASRFASASPHPRARLRVAVFAGTRPGVPAGVIALAPAASPPTTVRLAVSDMARNAADPLARHKTVDYLANSLVRQHALDAGFYDGIVIDSEGNVAETATANIFLGAGSRLVTPSLGTILPGIMRDWTLRNASALGLAVEERKVPKDALSSCDFAFITNSIIGLVAVSHIAGRQLKSASEEASFRRLLEAWHEVLHSHSQS